MNTVRIIPIALGVVFGGLACSDPTPVPPSGTAAVSLVTPHTDDGAVLLTVTGLGLTNPQPASSSYRLFYRLASTNEMHILVVGDVSAGPLFTIDVDDVGRLGSYAGTVFDVATRNDALRGSLSGYALTFARQ